MKENILWFHDFEGVICPDFGKKCIMVVGPSGVGKTTMVEYMEKNLKNFSVVPNCTTREKRDNEDGHMFNYMNEFTFRENIKNNSFFLYRINENPNYGYLKKDLNTIFSKNNYALFMFRYSGLDYLKDILRNFIVIVLESESKQIIKHSKDNVATHTTEETKNILFNNRKLYNELSKKGHKTLLIKNDYTQNFFREIDKVILQIYDSK